MLKTPSCPWRCVPGSRSKFGNCTTVPSLYSWNIAECDVKPQPTNQPTIMNIILIVTLTPHQFPQITTKECFKWKNLNEIRLSPAHTFVIGWYVVGVPGLTVVSVNNKYRLLAVVMLVALRKPDVASVDKSSSHRGSFYQKTCKLKCTLNICCP